jgi:hypothetical protein
MQILDIFNKEEEPLFYYTTYQKKEYVSLIPILCLIPNKKLYFKSLDNREELFLTINRIDKVYYENIHNIVHFSIVCDIESKNAF